MSCIKKTKRPTLEQHVEIGQAIKDYRFAFAKVLRLVSPFVLARTQDKLCQQFNFGPIELIRSELEDAMFYDFPWLSDAALSVYYGEEECVSADELIAKSKSEKQISRS